MIGAAPNQRTQSGWPSATGTGLGCWRPRQGIWSCGFPSCLPAGSFLASRLERRRGLDQALFAVVMQAYLHGVPTGKVDDLVRAWVLIAVAPRARCRGAAPTLRRGRRVPGCKARVNRRVVCQAVVVATGVAGDGHTEVLGLAVGDSAEELLACTSFPVSHWKQLWSTIPGAAAQGDQASHRRGGVFPNLRRCSAWPERSWLRRTRSGRSATAATCPKPPWPWSPRRPRRWRPPSFCRHRLPTLTPHGTTSYTTPRGVTPSVMTSASNSCLEGQATQERRVECGEQPRRSRPAQPRGTPPPHRRSTNRPRRGEADADTDADTRRDTGRPLTVCPVSGCPCGIPEASTCGRCLRGPHPMTAERWLSGAARRQFRDPRREADPGGDRFLAALSDTYEAVAPVPDRTTLRYVAVPDLEGDESGVLDLFMERAPAAGPVPSPVGVVTHLPQAAGGGSSGTRGWLRVEIRPRGGGSPESRPPLVVLVPTGASGPRRCACHASGRPCRERAAPSGRSGLGRAGPCWPDDRSSWSLPFRAGRQPSQSGGPPC